MRKSSLVISAAILGLAGPALAVPAAHAATELYASTGSAYGTAANVGTLIKSSPTASVGLCTTSAGTASNDAADTNLGLVGTADGVTTKTTSTVSGSTRKSVTTAKVGAIKLLGGVVTANAVTATASSEHTSSGYTQSASSTITGLTVAGAPVAATPGKNTKITLPNGLGTVILNRQSTSTTGGTRTISETAIQISINSSNTLGLPAGNVTVGHAASSIGSPIHHLASGSAWVSRVNAANGTVIAGSTAPSSIGCGGTAGAKATNTLAGVAAGKSVDTGTVTSSAQSTDSASATTATTGAKVSDINLLGGVVQLSALGVSARATESASAKTPTTTSSATIAGLKINGKPVTVSVKENTKINIAGVATLWLRKTSRSSTGISVYGAQLQLLTDESGLKAGTVISLGYASAAIAAS